MSSYYYSGELTVTGGSDSKIREIAEGTLGEDAEHIYISNGIITFSDLLAGAGAINYIVADIASAGLVANGNVSYYGDTDGGYRVKNNVAEDFDQNEWGLVIASDEALIAELVSRGYEPPIKSRTQPFYFRLPIGDWSGDGHGNCECYLVRSNKPLSEVREAHFAIKETTGIDIEVILDDSAHTYIEPELMSCFDKMGLTHAFSDTLLSDELANLWMLLLMQADPELKLTMECTDDFEMLPFYGIDDKGRHISSVGYGIA